MASGTAPDVVPGSRPRAVYFRRPDGSLSYTVAPPASSSPVAHYQFSPDRSWCLRRVLSPNGTDVLFKEVVQLDDRPRCSCGIIDHTAIAKDKLEALQRTTERLLPAEALHDLERDLRSQPEEVNEREYDGGYLPGGIGWFNEDGQPVERVDEVTWQDEVQIQDHLARFFDGLAGSDVGGNAKVLAPLVERVLFRTITHPPRLAGGWGDLFQEGLVTALQEAQKLHRAATEAADRYATRLERRVILAVRHRLIDAVRRQDAATRNIPCTSLEAGQNESDALAPFGRALQSSGDESPVGSVGALSSDLLFCHTYGAEDGAAVPYPGQRLSASGRRLYDRSPVRPRERLGPERPGRWRLRLGGARAQVANDSASSDSCEGGRSDLASTSASHRPPGTRFRLPRSNPGQR